MFVDRVTLFVKGGDGGNGCSSFRREKYVPKGGPDGGDGGDGGSVIIRADANADNLAGLTMKKHWKAKNGQPGSGTNCSGAAAADIVLLVPPGTIIRDRDRGNGLDRAVLLNRLRLAARGRVRIRERLGRIGLGGNGLRRGRGDGRPRYTLDGPSVTL